MRQYLDLMERVLSEGVEKRDRTGVVRGQLGARVEAEPPEPQQPGAEQHQREIVRPHRVVILASSLAEHDREREACGAPVDVDDRAAREVPRSPGRPSQPPPHTQWATGKYTSVAQATVNTAQAPNLVRSAIAPLISATVMTANVSWKAENMRSGMPFTL